MIKKNIAFTLAEVLLVAAIVAIVAALTVPSTKKSHDETALRTNARTVMAKLDTALTQVDMNELMIKTADTNAARSKAVLDEMAKYLKLSGNCGNLSNNGNNCFPLASITNGSLGNLDTPAQNSNCASAILNDGTEFAVCMVNRFPDNNSSVLSNNKNLYGFIAADLNGYKNPPNQRARDVYYYVINEDGTLALADASAQLQYESTSLQGARYSF